MKLNRTFNSIQGEGKYAGHPATFIRLSGCTRDCDFCDTKYHKKSEQLDVDSLVDIIKNRNDKIVVWTGGEPTMQISDIIKVIDKTPIYNHHLETNGDINIGEKYNKFDYVCISPKEESIAEKISSYEIKTDYDVKVVTDLELNKNLLSYATMLMPLSTFDEKKDKKIEQDVWNYCAKEGTKFCLRQHVKVWGQKKGV